MGSGDPETEDSASRALGRDSERVPEDNPADAVT